MLYVNNKRILLRYIWSENCLLCLRHIMDIYIHSAVKSKYLFHWHSKTKLAKMVRIIFMRTTQNFTSSLLCLLRMFRKSLIIVYFIFIWYIWIKIVLLKSQDCHYKIIFRSMNYANCMNRWFSFWRREMIILLFESYNTVILMIEIF